MSETETIVELRGVTRRFGRKTALEDVTLNSVTISTYGAPDPAPASGSASAAG